MSYKAGSLDIEFAAIDSNAAKSIGKIAISLSSLSATLSTVSTDKIKGFRQFSKILKNIPSSVSTDIDRIATSLSPLSTILDTISTDKLTGFRQFSTILKNISSGVSIDTAKINSASSALSVFFNSLSGITSGISGESIAKLSSISTALNSFTKITKFEKFDFSKVGDGFKSLTTAIEPFLLKVQNAEKSLTALYGVLQKVSSRKISSLTNANYAKIGRAGGFNIGRIFNIAMLFRFGRYMANIVQYGTDFTETLNLWQVAMRENLDQADEFINKMNKAYSISQRTLMNAQATFKNMVGSLGNISDAVAYQLSESILQMAVDFSSLYNVTFENAIQKFQAVLAGQVRPIRSVSGYDITETTLYQVYQQMGGTKTQRQLNRTEKQLLSIYAVFQQMQRSGAVGDLSKTLGNFANQSRMMTENFKELKTYVGLFLQDLLQSWGVLKYINAALIFATEVVKALINYEEPNFIQGMFETTIAENEALDELQGKLLDFDKFRALDTSSTTSDLEIDKTILNSVSQYESILQNVKNEARELATKWLKDIGLFVEDINGNLEISENKVTSIKDTLVAIGIAIGTISAINLGAALGRIITQVTHLTGGLSLLNTVIIGGIIFSFVKLIQAIKDGDTNAMLLSVTISSWLVFAFIKLNNEMLKTVKIKLIAFWVSLKKAFESLKPSLALATKNFSALNLALMTTSAILTYLAIDTILANMSEDFRKVVAPITAVTGAILALTGALTYFKAIASGGTALPSLLVAAAGAGMLVAGIKNSIPKYAVGASNIDGGTLFIAGEAGKTETVFSGTNGKTNVANVQQMKAAFLQALIEYGETKQDNQPIVVTLDGEVVYRNTTAQAKKRGQVWSKS